MHYCLMYKVNLFISGVTKTILKAMKLEENLEIKHRLNVNEVKLLVRY